MKTTMNRKTKTLSRYVKEADRIGRMVELKQAAYGDSVGKSPEILRMLYPCGINPNQYGDLMMLTRVLDKLHRIATNKTAFGEDPWTDIAGYALLSIVGYQELRRKKENGHGTGSSRDT